MKNANIEEQYQILVNRMFKILKNKPYSANRNHVNKIAAQIHYLGRMIVPNTDTLPTE